MSRRIGTLAAVLFMTREPTATQGKSRHNHTSNRKCKTPGRGASLGRLHIQTREKLERAELRLKKRYFFRGERENYLPAKAATKMDGFDGGDVGNVWGTLRLAETFRTGMIEIEYH